MRHLENDGRLVRRVGPAIALLLLLGSPTRAELRWVDRPDSMDNYWLADVDQLGDTIRILYQTLPSLEQAADKENWRVNVHLVEVSPDGKVRQRQLASAQRYYNSLVLRRGANEVLAVPTPGGPGPGPQSLELWSGQDGRVLGSGAVELIPDRGAYNRNITPTDDGNLFVVNATELLENESAVTELTWHKLSPRGEILASGSLRQGGSELRVTGRFPVRSGGVGLTVAVSQGRRGAPVETDIENPIRKPLHGRTLEATVFSETRMLATGGDGVSLWLSPALERMFMWGGEMAVPQDLPPQEMMQQTQDQLRLVAGVERTHDAGRSVGSRSRDNEHQVKPTQDGYAVLARVAADQDLDPPVAGPHYLEIGPDGSLKRDVYLGNVARSLGAQKFIDFLPMDDGGILVVGPGQPPGSHDSLRHATRTDAVGKPLWTVPLGTGGQLDGVTGTSKNAWAFGNGWRDGVRGGRLWIERVDESRSVPLAELPRKASRRKPDEPKAPALPAPAVEGKASGPGSGAGKTGDCTCECKEYADLRKLLESIEKMPDEEKMKVATDPEFLGKMMCASSCAMEYAACPQK